MRPRSIAGSLSLILIASASCAAIASHARAQQATELPEVTVEARKKEVRTTNTRLDAGGTSGQSGVASDVPATGNVNGSASASGGGITGASTTVITREDIERAPQATLADIIWARGGRADTEPLWRRQRRRHDVDLRGFGVAAPSNTLVLINGRRLNDWDLQGFDLSTIAKDSVERIEITRGNSGAVLYGDGAVGGVINIVTRSGGAFPTRCASRAAWARLPPEKTTLRRAARRVTFPYFVNGNALRLGWLSRQQ